MDSCAPHVRGARARSPHSVQSTDPSCRGVCVQNMSSVGGPPSALALSFSLPAQWLTFAVGRVVTLNDAVMLKPAQW